MPPQPIMWPAHAKLRGLAWERGEGRIKHKWKHDRAGFLPSKSGPVGKCHRSISETLAEQLLTTGLPEQSPYDDDEKPPNQIFNVYRGVPYVAVPTRPGRSYHGYPYRGRLSATMRRALEARARSEGSLKTYRRWLKEYCEC